MKKLASKKKVLLISLLVVMTAVAVLMASIGLFAYWTYDHYVAWYDRTPSIKELSFKNSTLAEMIFDDCVEMYERADLFGTILWEVRRTDEGCIWYIHDVDIDPAAYEQSKIGLEIKGRYACIIDDTLKQALIEHEGTPTEFAKEYCDQVI